MPEGSPLPPFAWLSPTRVLFGEGRLATLPPVVAELAGRRAGVLLVTGRRSLRAAGVLGLVIEMLGEERVTLFDRVVPFPSPELVDEAVALCREALPDVVVAVGGGSPIDLGKAVAALFTHDGTAREHAQGTKSLQRRGLPFVAVPTTSGSSSEVTSGAALWDMDAREHMGLGSPLMFPDAAIVDPVLAMTMPRDVAAASGMDAFTSAFESYWSTEAQPLSDTLNLEVIRLFSQNLERSCNDGDRASRAACALAATMSGIAYSNSRPNICHAVGSPLTLYWNVDHGQSVGVTLTTFLRSQAETVSPSQASGPLGRDGSVRPRRGGPPADGDHGQLRPRDAPGPSRSHGGRPGDAVGAHQMGPPHHAAAPPRQRHRIPPAPPPALRLVV